MNRQKYKKNNDPYTHVIQQFQTFEGISECILTKPSHLILALFSEINPELTVILRNGK